MTIFVYLVPIVLAGAGSAVFRGNRRLSVILGWTAFLWAMVVLSIRYDVGYDYHSYIASFRSALPPREPLSQFLFAFNQMVGTAEAYVVSFAIISSVFLISAFRNQPNARYAFFLFLALPAFYLDMYSLVRQLTAVSVCIYAMSLSDERWALRGVLGLVAIGFHLSGIAFCIWLMMFEFQKRQSVGRWCILGAATVLALALIWFFDTEIGSSLGIANELSFLGFYLGENRYGLPMVVLATLLVLMLKVVSNFNKQYFWSCFSVLALVFWLTNIDGVYSRLTVYGLIPILFVNWRLNWGGKDISWFILTFIGCSEFLVMLYIKSLLEHGPLVPYQTLLLT